MKITEFDKPIIRAMRPAIEKALSALEEQYGIKVSLGSGTFTSSNVTFKFEMAVIGEGGQAETKEVSEFKRMAQLYGLEASDLGRRFVSRGQEFKIIGLRATARKRPIIAEGAGGKKFVFPVRMVKLALGLSTHDYDSPGTRLGDVLNIPPPPPLVGGQPKSASSPAKGVASPSKGATKRVWEIADSLIVRSVRIKSMAGGVTAPKDIPPARPDVIEACVAAGINPSTASTQYGKWRKARGF